MQRQSGLSRDKFWREILVRQRARGLSIQRFCAKEGLAVATFFAWKRRLGQEAGGGAVAVNFAPMRVVTEVLTHHQPAPILKSPVVVVSTAMRAP